MQRYFLTESGIILSHLLSDKIKIWMHSNFFSKPHIQIYLINGVLLGTRTLDPLIKSQLLYQLS